MKKILLLAFLLFIAGFCSACINTFAVHELNNIAFKYIEEGNYKAAISRLESSVDLDADNFDSRYNLAVAYTKNKQCIKAIEQINEAKKINSSDPSIHYMTGYSYDCAVEEILNNENQNKIDYDKILEYLDLSIKSFEDYLRIAKDANDAQQVLNRINVNKDLITQYKDFKQN